MGRSKTRKKTFFEKNTEALKTKKRFGAKGQRVAPSANLVKAVDEIVAMARPELTEEERNKAALAIAIRSRPGRAILSRTEIARSRAAVAHALESAEQSVSSDRRLTH